MQEAGVRPSRRLGYRFDVDFAATPSGLGLVIANRGELGVGLQARSLTVAGAPFSYTIGSGEQMAVTLPDPGTYDLSIHGPNGFFRHFAGSALTSLAVSAQADVRRGTVTLRIIDRGHRPGRRGPVVVAVTDAYGPARELELSGGEAVVRVATAASGGWYDLTLSTPSDVTFAYGLAGRVESEMSLTSDPQLGAGA